jgi:hypothetical protein
MRLTLTDPLHISGTDSNVPLQELTHSPSPEGYTRGSFEADFGRKRIGCVDLPKPLIQGINDLVDQQPDKRLVRTDALRLYESLRSTSRLPMEKEGSDRYANRRNKAKSKSIDTQQQQIQQQQQQQGVEPHILSYGPRESAAYTAGVLPSTYGAITNVLHEVKNRLSNFTPSSLLDFGTGPGTAIW